MIRKKPKFTATQVRYLMHKIRAPLRGFSCADVAKGMDVETEHGLRGELTNVTGDDPVLTLRIALAHLYERKDYYELLEKMEALPRPNPSPNLFTDEWISAKSKAIKKRGELFARTTIDGYTLDVYRYDEYDIHWILRKGQGSYGVGEIGFHPPLNRYIVNVSAVRTKYRRQGLYPKVIVALRKLFGAAIQSGRHRSFGADRAWKKTGASYYDVEDVWRLNPG